MRPPQGFEWLLIVFIVLLLFGSKRLPDMARGIGRSLRILKAETRGLAADDEAAGAPAAGTGAASAKPAEITDSAAAAPAPAEVEQQPQADKTTS